MRCRRTMRDGLVAAAGAGALVASLAPAAPIGAQTVRGSLVDDDTGAGIAGARITLLRPDSSALRSTLSDSLGSFVLSVPRLGRYMLRAERIGYRSTVSQTFEVARLDTLTVQFFVSTEAVLLDPIVVSVGMRPGRELFEGRQALERGVFFGPETVDSLRPETHVGEILEHVDKVRVRWEWGSHESGGSGPIPTVRTYLGRSCVYYIVDYTPVPRPFFEGVRPWGVSPLAELEPDDIVAVEVYRSFHEVPKDFARHVIAANGQTRRRLRDMQRGMCGIVVFWTERGW